VLENGEIAETGTHAALIENGGLYSHLYALQFRDLDEPGAFVRDYTVSFRSRGVGLSAFGPDLRMLCCTVERRWAIRINGPAGFSHRGRPC
jgi:hypothetical protein